MAYRDGSARYLNYSGKVLLWEARSDAEIEAAITGWLAVGQVIADATGVWDQPSLPPVPPGQARLLMLTPGGHRFGQAPGSAVSCDPHGRPVHRGRNPRPAADHQPRLTHKPSQPFLSASVCGVLKGRTRIISARGRSRSRRIGLICTRSSGYAARAAPAHHGRSRATGATSSCHHT